VRRVHARIGYVPIHVGLVTGQLPIVRVTHYREHSPGGPKSCLTSKLSLQRHGS
jgi:hypothetical protein